ncbi:DUF4870 domain-containing protein [Bacillus kwashiorkori]|uniref:DUF4870 domain-containing protein n=1 Tax=Bacillus kwashiorkori TaxID=1522318 RepID=UPI00078278EA|nr:DUF4870 domain-containing protein [Bacillus kwashiorkori]
MVSKDERLFAALIFGFNFFAPVIGPLIIWLFKREDSPYIDYYGREYFNFLISFAIYGIVAGILTIILIGILLLIILGIASFIIIILGIFKAYEGEKFRIPFIIRFL